MGIDLTGEVAVVTGASGRLGTLWVQVLSGAGAAVAALDLTGAEELAGSADSGLGRVLRLTADVTDRGSLRDALAETTEQLGSPTVLVNNAGVDQPPSTEQGSWLFEDLPDDLSAAVLAVNVLGVLKVCQVFGADMAARGRGSVINIGSLYGNVAPDPRMYAHLPLDPPFLKPPAYGASKAGVSALTRYLATLWGPRGVRVNTLSPGGVQGGQDSTFLEQYTARVPLGRMAQLTDLAGPLLFLASGLSSYVTGHELLVDGGFVSW
ncbi:SDR family oxidoreductase [Streptomyces sp. NPDC006530]|uniref:SDR family oxidoreductase n=1 Tax=Streptomyces sp. NPDC006530 TaxID=3364750 RepID=UPI0036AD67BB